MIKIIIGSDSLGSVDRECILELLPPPDQQGSIVMLQLFSSIYGQDRQLLSDAYEAARTELQDGYHINGSELGTLVRPLVEALVSAYSAGQYKQTALTRDAICRVLNTTARGTGKKQIGLSLQ